MSARILLSHQKIEIILNRLSSQLIERFDDFKNVVLVGLQPRGIHLLDRLVNLLEVEYGIKQVTYGKLDITFFRDDFRRSDKTLSPSASEMEITIEGKSVVIIDDVLYTGRSIRAALTALDYYGRPKDIQLLVLIDRRFSRDLPIQPDYTGAQVDALEGDKVRVQWKQLANEDTVFIEKR
ncbi:MAG: bifunctional pyr operon transcriptional regulator/uracil phosphoribosyltransferase PyrR [Bacteroidetes bacterium]|nr:bifunctional pyr operon transcriptional regulator/uracil phosphoribosyltransferase PyrR [Bacteroidota bacterium]MDA0936780.1 bifunctional pyr operon transcriptional regulator/uracil phosphoribosyltransferase PyrR [Bacteroidota bacterium]